MAATAEQASLYLNLATALLNSNKGSLEFLTGNKTHKIDGVNESSDSQETQVLTFGTSIWIANNDDTDSATQEKFLKKIGVTTRDGLLTHVETYRSRVLGRWGTKVWDTHQKAPKEKYLFGLVGTDKKKTLGGAMASPPGNGAVTVYSLTSTLPPASVPILIVTGAYTGEGGTLYHAEQKLIAAFGRYVKQNPSVYAAVVAGNKPACTKCDSVLAAVATRLGQLERVSTLTYTRTASSAHTAAGLGVDDPAGVCKADIDTYYPPVHVAEEEPTEET